MQVSVVISVASHHSVWIKHTLIFQIISEISLLQAILLTACVCVWVSFFDYVFNFCSLLCNGLCVPVWRNSTWRIPHDRRMVSTEPSLMTGGRFLLNQLSWPEDDFCWTVSHDPLMTHLLCLFYTAEDITFHQCSSLSPTLAFHAYPNACISCLLECPQTVL